MYQVNISNHGDYKFDVASKDYQFVVDIKGKGVTPPDAFLASIGSCIGVYIRKYAEGTRLDIKDFDISVQAEFTKDAPIRFARIDVAIDLKGANIDERRKAALLEFIKNCPVHNTIKNNPETIVIIK
jgi:putative redox protein